MIEIEVAGLMAIIDANVAIKGITLIAGPNGSGKSTIIDAARCALLGQATMPQRDVRHKKGANVLLHHGFQKAHACIRDNDGRRTIIEWPSCEVSKEMGGIDANACAIGAMPFTSMSQDQRTELLRSLYPEYTINENTITTSLNNAKIDPEKINKIVKYVMKQGLDAAYDEMRKRRTKKKGEWEHVTGARYGSAAAESWFPDAWRDELIDIAPSTLSRMIAEQENSLKDAIGDSAVRREALARLEKKVADIGKTRAMVNLLESDITTFADELDSLSQQRQKYPEKIATSVLSCPHCGKPLKVEQSQGVLRIDKGEPADEESEEKVREMRMTIAKLDGKIENVKARINQARSDLEKAKRTLLEQERAESELAGMPEVSNDDDDVSAKQKRLDELRADEKMLADYLASRDILSDINTLSKLVEILGPKGLRNELAQKSRAKFNLRLIELSEICGVPHIEIRDDMTVAVGERLTYGLMSTGYKLAIDAMIQIAIAEATGSPLVLIDHAEVLIDRLRTGVFKALKQCGIPSIVCIAAKDQDKVPRLGRKRLGTTYWADCGEIHELA